MSEEMIPLKKTGILAEDTEVELSAIDVELPGKRRKPRRTRKRRRWFGKALVAYTVLLFAGVACALWFLNTALKAESEKSTRPILETYVSWLELGDYDAIYEASGFVPDALNTKQQYITYLKSLYEGAESFSVREVPTPTGPKHYAVYDGNKKLSDITLTANPEGNGSSWYVTTDITRQPTYTLVASEDIQLTVNGVDIHRLDLPSENLEETLFPLPDGSVLELPAIRVYTLASLINPPVFEALTLGGDPCLVETSGTISVMTLPETTNEQYEAEDRAVIATSIYAAFMKTGKNLEELAPLVHPASGLYRKINEHTVTESVDDDIYQLREIETTNYYRYADDAYTCEISYRPLYGFQGNLIDDCPTEHYRLSFLKQNDEWLLYDITPIEEKDESAE